MTERPPFEAAIVKRVHASFARQGAMATLGAELADVAAGHVAIAVPVEPRLSQQNGFLHAGVVVAALDTACGYAALTLMPDAEVLTVELKVNLLAPATGDRIVAGGRGRPRRWHADRLPRRRVRRAGQRARARGDDAGHHGASARRLIVAPSRPSGRLLEQRRLRECSGMSLERGALPDAGRVRSELRALLRNGLSLTTSRSSASPRASATALVLRPVAMLVLVVRRCALVVLRCALDRGYPALAPFHPDLISGLQLEGRLVQTSDPNLDERVVPVGCVKEPRPTAGAEAATVIA